MAEPTMEADGREARLIRERSFHDERFAEEHRQAASKYYAVDSGAAAYEAMLQAESRTGSSVLEYGCGTGSKAFSLAALGAAVTGIDISGIGVFQAMSQAVSSGCDARFLQMDAERLGFRSSSFDVVSGSGILHHLDLEDALDEVGRVLRPGGVAVFYEPLGTNPLINLYRRLTPKMRTPDEHPLLPDDFDQMRRVFREVRVEHHNFLSLAGVGVRRVPVIGSALVTWLQRADQALFRRVPWTRRLAWVAVVRLTA